MANIMKHDRISGTRKIANLSRVAATGKVLSQYDFISKVAQQLHEANLRFNNIIDFFKQEMKQNFISTRCQGEHTLAGDLMRASNQKIIN